MSDADLNAYAAGADYDGLAFHTADPGSDPDAFVAGGGGEVAITMGAPGAAGPFSSTPATPGRVYSSLVSGTLSEAATYVSGRRAGASASADQPRATRKHYGAIPIIVLTHSPYPKAKDETQDERNQRTLLWESLHLDVAAMSTRGVNEIVPNSGHYIQYDHPQVVVDAISQALAIARERTRKPQ